MRKVVHIVFSMLLFIVSAGFTLSKHYCHDQLISVEIDQEAESCCDDGSCCRTETVLVQLDDDAIAKAIVSAPAISMNTLFIQTAIELLFPTLTANEEVEYHEYISPPPLKIQTVLSSLQTYLL